MDDIITDETLTIEQLYKLAKKEGIEKRKFHFSVKDIDNNISFFKSTLKSFGKGWTKDTAIFNLECNQLNELHSMPNN